MKYIISVIIIVIMASFTNAQDNRILLKPLSYQIKIRNEFMKLNKKQERNQLEEIAINQNENKKNQTSLKEETQKNFFSTREQLELESKELEKELNNIRILK